MKNRKGELMVFLAALLMAAMVITGCSKPAAASGTASADTPSVLQLVIDRVTFGSGSPKGTLVDETWKKMASEYLGVPLDLNIRETLQGEYQERQAMYLASGDFADIFYVSGTKEVFDIGQQGMLVNLNNYPEETKNYIAFASQEPNAFIWLTAPDGGRYSFGDFIFSTNWGTNLTAQVKKDIFEKHNLKAPETLDELYQTAKQLKSLYPDSYPVLGSATLITLYGIYGMPTWDRVYFDGSKFEYKYSSPQYRAMVTYLNKLYSERLLDPETFTDTNLISEAKRINNKGFYAFEWMDYGPLNNPGVYAYVPHPSADGRGPAFYAQENVDGVLISANGSYNIAVSAKTKYPALALKLVDWQYSKEGLDLFNWGVEGVTYTRKADGSKEFLPVILDAPVRTTKLAEYGINTSYGIRSGIQFVPQDRDVISNIGVTAPVWLDGGFREPMTSWLYYDALNKAGKMKTNPVGPATSFTQAELDIISPITTAVDTFGSEMEMKFITGATALTDANWNKYLSDLKTYGDIDRVLSIYNSKIK